MGQMQNGWFLARERIGYRTEAGEDVYPSAAEIFSMVFPKTVDETCKNSETPTILPLQFSRFPLTLILEICISNHALCLKLSANQNEKTILALSDLSACNFDYFIADGIWYPVERSSRETVCSIIERYKPNEKGQIKLLQYLEMKRDLDGNPWVKDALKDVELLQLAQNSEAASPNFNGKLYSYQSDGLNWLRMLSRESMGGILADQMGLGKTPQIVALLLDEVAAGRTPNLVVMPTTIIENWRREIAHFAPSLSVLVHHGPDRTGFPQRLSEKDVVLTSYETVVRDESMLQMPRWNLLVADEAQALKNPEAQRSIAIKNIPARIHVAVTGTPLENRLLDIWSITEFALPGFLGSRSGFESAFANDAVGAQRLEPLISPIMLRRLVAEVAKDLPSRIDIPEAIRMDEKSAMQYEDIRKIAAAKANSKAMSLALLMKLRQYCTHPFLISGNCGDPSGQSLKYGRFLEILEEIVESREKVLVFTPFVQMINLMTTDLKNRLGIHTDSIYGNVPLPERQAIIDKFSGVDRPAALILNPRVAGAGLNISAANHVIHYSLEWNPAVEDQASARAYRRGQTRPVTVHRLFYSNTVEEIMDQRIQYKRHLAHNAVIGITDPEAAAADIIKALRISPIGG